MAPDRTADDVALHSYACDCVTHHLFHPYGTNCLENKDDGDMMHQVASDDSLQSACPLTGGPAFLVMSSGKGLTSQQTG